MSDFFCFFHIFLRRKQIFLFFRTYKKEKAKENTILKGKHFNKVLIMGILLALFACTAIGCGKSAESSEKTSGKVTVIKEQSQLERGRFYVETEDGYAVPYWGNTSFDTGSNYNSSNEQRVAWFTDQDWDCIPTVYAGSKVVYRTNEDFDETFYFQKFADIGYSIGVCNMTTTDTGRYKFSTDLDRNQINPSSDASKLLDLQGVNVTIDTVGGALVRSNMVSSCGTILGLNANEDYPVDIYVGTEIQNYSLKADSRVLNNIQVNRMTQYEFVKAEIIEIPIPSTFASGYYSVNGSGLFRYISAEDKGKDYTKIDMNQLNLGDGDYSDYLGNNQYYEHNHTETLTLANNGTYTIRVHIDGDPNPDLLVGEYDQPLSVFVTVDSKPIELKKNQEGVYTATFEATRGIAMLEYKNINGRVHSYSLLYHDPEEELLEDSELPLGSSEAPVESPEVTEEK